MTRGIQAEKAVSIWKRPVKFQLKDLFISAAKAAIDGATGKWADAAKSASDMLGALGLEETDENLAWLLVHRSLMRAVFDLLLENRDVLEGKELNSDVVAEKAAEAIEEKWVLDRHFFDNPLIYPFVGNVQRILYDWIVQLGMDESDAQALSSRFPAYFVFALHDEWRSGEKQYIRLREALDTPFAKAGERELSWRRYAAWLQRQVQERMFGESISLQQVYVPLRGYYERKDRVDGNGDFAQESINVKRVSVVVDLEVEIEAWLRKADPRDAIRVISGGPGSGKSSFAKIFAAKHSSSNLFRLLFVPLHRFELTDDLIDAIAVFLRYDNYISHNPLDPREGEPRVFVIFDGLDELAMQGKGAAEAAQKFVREVERKVYALNTGPRARFQALIVGRELVVQANSSEFRQKGQILHILPYIIKVGDEEGERHWEDKRRLLKKDQRAIWWQQFGAASGKEFDGLPAELAREDLAEVTAQPLLNYLVALGYARGLINFTDEFNLNALYHDLIAAVYTRGWAEHRHPSVRNLALGDFVRVLEEVALAAWHGDGRTTTVKEIEEHCKHSGLSSLLSAFQKGAEDGVASLLAAFYFRQRGDLGGDKTFEFTHKSFGEYLTARRLIRAVDKIGKMIDQRQKDPDFGWDLREALLHWLEVTGETAIDAYLFEFVARELRLRDRDLVRQWQAMVADLLGSVISHGFPVERMAASITFREAVRWTRNAGEAVLAVHAACAMLTNKVSRIETMSPDAFGAWFGTLQPQRTGPANRLAFSCLHHLDLRSYVFDMQDFFAADLHHSVLSECAFNYAVLWDSNLKGCNFANAVLNGADLRDTDLTGSNLSNATLMNAHLQGARLQRADLTRTVIQNADVEDLDLRGVDLSSARIGGLDLRRTRITGARMVRSTAGEGSESIDVVKSKEPKRAANKARQKPS